MFYFDKSRNTTHKIKHVFERDGQTHYVPRCGFGTTFTQPKGSALQFLFSGCEQCKICLEIDREKNRINDHVRRLFLRLLDLPNRWREKEERIRWIRSHKEEIEVGRRLSKEIEERLRKLGLSKETV